MRLSPSLPSWALVVLQIAKLLIGGDKQARCCDCCVSVGVEIEKEERRSSSEPSVTEVKASSVTTLEVVAVAGTRIKQAKGLTELQMTARFRDHLGSAVVEAEFLSRLKVGSYTSVFYRDDTVWHQRLLLWRRKGCFSRWVIYTPDGDLYEEDFAGDPGDGIARAVLHSVGQDRPRCLRGAYRFRALPSEVEVKALVVQARTLLGAQSALSGDLGEACRADGSACPIHHYVPEETLEETPAGTWRVVDLVEGYRVGTEVPDERVVARHRNVGLAELRGKIVKVEKIEAESVKDWVEKARKHVDISQGSDGAETDIRTLAVEFDGTGK
eukprot:5923617-Amphidinium_carterae.1